MSLNQELLNTPIVKQSIIRYLKQELSLNEILQKLLDIQLIIISKDELQIFIKDNNLNNPLK
jgi:hypothetical protein